MKHDDRDPDATMAQCKRCGLLGSLREIREHLREADDRTHKHIEEWILDRSIRLYYEEVADDGV